jgi:hypothetical protein
LESIVDKINRPSWRLGATLGDSFAFRISFSISKASPNDSEIVIIVVIIVIGEAKCVLHIGGIIAQTVYLNRVCFSRRGVKANADMLHPADTNGGC